MLGWAGCTVLLLARFVRAMVRTRRLLRQAVPLPPERLPVDVESLRRAVGLRATVRWAIDARLEVAEQELAAQGEFAYCIVNDDLEKAAAELEEIVRNELGLPIEDS